MDASVILERLCRVIDEHRWDDLAELLSPDFRCRYVHTGEELDRAEWVRLNAEYPGFERMVVEDVVGSGRRAVARCTVTAVGDEGRQTYGVATFVACDENRVMDMVEVWCDVGQTPPDLARPS